MTLQPILCAHTRYLSQQNQLVIPPKFLTYSRLFKLRLLLQAGRFTAKPNMLNRSEKGGVTHADVIIRIRGGAVSPGRDLTTLRWRQRREIVWQKSGESRLRLVLRKLANCRARARAARCNGNQCDTRAG